MQAISFEYYYDVFNGKMPQSEFESVIDSAAILVEKYAMQFIAPWNQEKVEFDVLELKDAVCYQADYLQTNGGLNAINGTSDLDLQSVSKDGFNYSYSNDRGNRFNGIPFSPISAYMIEKELRKNGLMSRVVK